MRTSQKIGLRYVTTTKNNFSEIHIQANALRASHFLVHFFAALCTFPRVKISQEDDFFYNLLLLTLGLLESICSHIIYLAKALIQE